MKLIINWDKPSASIHLSFFYNVNSINYYSAILFPLNKIASLPKIAERRKNVYT